MIISIINLKGGVSKTTTAIALATAAHRAGEAVRVLDADAQSSASLWDLSAADGGDPLPFAVQSANIATLRRLKPSDEWVIIDCPPSGSVTDEAMDVADFVIVPTTPAPIDMQQTWTTAETVEGNGKPYAVLLTRCLPNTITLKAALAQLEEQDMSVFDARIPQREDIKNYFGNAFGESLYGYERVYEEIKEAF